MRAALALLLGALATSCLGFADSQARIVRLSLVEGDVQVERVPGRGFENAAMNLPVTQGDKFEAGFDGFCEIEFEDGSTLRFTSSASLEISQLALRDSGAKATTVNVLDGVVYVNYEGARDDEFALTFGAEKVRLTKSTRIRLEVARSQTRLSVLNGATVQVEGPLGTTRVEKKHAITFATDGQTPPIPAVAVTKLQSDAWDQRQFEYHERYALSQGYSSSPYAIGMSDLNYYGYFFNSPVCGLAWRPYFVSGGWDPLVEGLWAWFQNSGYSWVSSYPWGWLPYHYGSWQMCPGYGWAWQPGGTLVGLNNFPILPRLPRPIHPPTHPPEPASGPRHIPLSFLTKRVVIRDDSAGMGIPRGSIPNLRQLSREVDQHGPVTAMVYVLPGSTHAVYFGDANSGSAFRGWQQGTTGAHNQPKNFQRANLGSKNPAGGSSHPSGGMFPQGGGTPAGSGAPASNAGGTKTYSK